MGPWEFPISSLLGIALTDFDKIGNRSLHRPLDPLYQFFTIQRLGFGDTTCNAVSGAGKTTLLNVLTGTITPGCGHVTLNGETIDRRWRRKMAYVMQHDAFYANLTLRETLTVCSSSSSSSCCCCCGVGGGGG